METRESFLDKIKSGFGRTGDRFIDFLPANEGSVLEFVPYVRRYLMLPSDARAVIQVLQRYVDTVTDEEIEAENEEITKELFAEIEGLKQPPATTNKKTWVSSDPGFIYLVHATGTNRYKIGLAADISKRMSQLSKQSAFPLALITSHPSDDMPRDEEHWHKFFEKQRVHGEWFELSDEQVLIFRSTAKTRSEAV